MSQLWKVLPQMTATKEMIVAAREAASLAYVPYSHFPVGVRLLKAAILKMLVLVYQIVLNGQLFLKQFQKVSKILTHSMFLEKQKNQLALVVLADKYLQNFVQPICRFILSQKMIK